tara:strand:- start:256 stop:741 length:486 start_codon:yes stop_codon:yes gene_type:complete
MLTVKCTTNIYYATCSICKRSSLRHLISKKKKIIKKINLLKWEETDTCFNCDQCGNTNNLFLDNTNKNEVFTWNLLDDIFNVYLASRNKIEMLKRRYRKIHKFNFEDKWIYRKLSNINLRNFGYLKNEIFVLLKKNTYYNLYNNSEDSYEQKADKIIKYYL